MCKICNICTTCNICLVVNALVRSAYDNVSHLGLTYSSLVPRPTCWWKSGRTLSGQIPIRNAEIVVLSYYSHFQRALLLFKFLTIFSSSYQFWYCKAYDVNLVDVDRDWLWESRGIMYFVFVFIFKHIFFFVWSWYLSLYFWVQQEKRNQTIRLQLDRAWIKVTITLDRDLRWSHFEGQRLWG